MGLESQPQPVGRLNLPDAKGSEGILALGRFAPDVPITVISANEDPDMIAAVMAAGAQGYISKAGDPSELITAVRTASAKSLSPFDSPPELINPARPIKQLATWYRHRSIG